MMLGASQGPRDESVRACTVAPRVAFRGPRRASPPFDDAKVVRHGRYATFQLAEVAVPRDLFGRILRLIDGLRPAPLPP